MDVLDRDDHRALLGESGHPHADRRGGSRWRVPRVQTRPSRSSSAGSSVSERSRARLREDVRDLRRREQAELGPELRPDGERRFAFLGADPVPEHLDERPVDDLRPVRDGNDPRARLRAPRPAIAARSRRRVFPMPASPSRRVIWPRPASSSPMTSRRRSSLGVAVDERAGTGGSERCVPVRSAAMCSRARAGPSRSLPRAARGRTSRIKHLRRRLADDDRARPGDALQSRRDVRACRPIDTAWGEAAPTSPTAVTPVLIPMRTLKSEICQALLDLLGVPLHVGCDREAQPVPRARRRPRGPGASRRKPRSRHPCTPAPCRRTAPPHGSSG